MIVQRFNLNLIPNQSPVIVHVNQYDTGTGRLVATLYEGNEPYSPSGTAVIQGTKPDGHGFQYTATLDGNVVTADLTEQMSPVAGDVRVQIVVTESSGETGTFVFIMRVQPSALPSDADMSESDYPLIEEAIREAQEAVIDSHDNAENSEAWAQGTRGGIPVGPTDPTYQHNAEYWAHQAEGAASGVSSFNGRSGSVLPIAGDYDSEKILLASALHIGGETQSNVQEALEALVNDGGAGHTILNGLGQEMPQRKNLRFAGANLSDDAENDTTNVTITGGSGGSTITVTTIETTLYGETVTITDGTSTFTGVFDNSGVCVIDGVTATGTLTITSGAATNQLNVPYYGNYTTFLSFWAATINVTTDPDIVSAIVKKDGVQIGTVNFTSGSGTYIAGSTGAYTFEVTVGGIVFSSPTVNVTQQTTYSTIIDIFNATLSISTSSSELYGKTITIKKGSTTVGTTVFSAQGSATYTVHETGTYTCECEGYSGSATVSAETTYSVTINAGLDLASWITAGSTSDYPLNPSSYADFSALEADEAAIRQLMTVHASVDYLAQATAGDSLMESVIGSDVCAKWINLSDYALDTLSANSDIKSVMNTADKYGYGEWGKIDSTTWGPLGNVPIMTANNAPYGVASAYKVFDGNASTSASGTDFSYQSVNPICVKRYKALGANGVTITGTIQGSNNGSTWTNINLASNTTYYMYHRLHLASSTAVYTLQFYGRELTVKQASAPTDGRKYIQIGSDYYTEDWGEKEFAQGSTRKTIYDHGVKPSGALLFNSPWQAGANYNTPIENSNSIDVYNPNNANNDSGFITSNSIAISTAGISNLYCKVGSRLERFYKFVVASTNTGSWGSDLVSQKQIEPPITDTTASLDVSSDSSGYIGVMNYNGSTPAGASYARITELWLE